MQLGKKIRFWFLALLWVILTLCMACRLVYLATYQRGFLIGQSKARVERKMVISAKRGRILDRNGEILAMSRPVNDIWACPKALLAEKAALSKISNILNISEAALEQKLNKNNNKDFMYIARNIDAAIADQIKESGITSVYATQSYSRFYPGGKASSQLVGMVNVDGQGIEGIEFMYDKQLSGESGHAQYIINPFGETIESISKKEPEAGQDIRLTIDRSIQYLTYEALKEGAKKTGAKSAHGVVIDVKTGDIIAATNYPSYNPESLSAHEASTGKMRHKIFTDLYEPGSTFKPITMAYVLDHIEIHDGFEMATDPGELRFGENTIRDVKNFGKISLDDIIVKSSNIGIAKLLLKDPTGFIPWLRNEMAIDKKKPTSFPGTPKGRIGVQQIPTEFEMATMAFGYGVSLTPLQLAQHYLVLANGGYLQDVQLIHDGMKSEHSKKRVISPETTKKIRAMLHKTTSSEGTARRAGVKGVKVAGKTGTTHFYEDGKYWDDRHVASFAGFAPYEDPQYVVVIVVEEPKQQYHFGGLAAAPIFSKIVFNSQFISRH